MLFSLDQATGLLPLEHKTNKNWPFPHWGPSVWFNIHVVQSLETTIPSDGQVQLTVCRVGLHFFKDVVCAWRIVIFHLAFKHSSLPCTHSLHGDQYSTQSPVEIDSRYCKEIRGSEFTWKVRVLNLGLIQFIQPRFSQEESRCPHCPNSAKVASYLCYS